MLWISLEISQREAQNFMDAKKKGHISDTRDFGVMPRLRVVQGGCDVPMIKVQADIERTQQKRRRYPRPKAPVEDAQAQ